MTAKTDQKLTHDTICMKCDVWKENDNTPIIGCQKCCQSLHLKCVPIGIDVRNGFVCNQIGEEFKCENRLPVESKLMPPAKYDANDQKYFLDRSLQSLC